MKRIALEAEVIVRLDYSTDEAHVCVSSLPAMAQKMERLFGPALDNKAGQSRRWKAPAGANSLEGIAQHYAMLRIVIANVVLDPSLPLAA